MYKKREINLAKRFALYYSKIERFDKNINDTWDNFLLECNKIELQAKNENKSWEIVSFQIGRFNNISGISTDRTTEQSTKWDVIYKYGDRFAIGHHSAIYYDYKRMLIRPETYKIWQVKINNQLYNLNDVYPKVSGKTRIQAFFMKGEDLFIQTTTNGKILIK